MYFPLNTSMIAIPHIINVEGLKISISSTPFFFVCVLLSYEFAKFFQIGNPAPEPVLMLGAHIPC